MKSNKCMSLIKENVMVIIYMYALVKTILFRSTLFRNFKLATIILSILVSIILSGLVLITLSILIFYKSVIAKVIQARCPELYGMLNGPDKFWSLNKNSRSIINVLLVVETNLTKDTIRCFVEDTFTKMIHNHPKLRCVKQYSMGYHYYKLTNIEINRFVKTIKEYNNLEEFRLSLNHHSNSPLPLNDTALWEVLIGETKINWKPTQSGKKQFPIIFRFHHSVGDGASLMNILVSYFGRNGVDVIRNYMNEFNDSLNVRKRNNREGWFAKFLEAISSLNTVYLNIIANVDSENRTLLSRRKLTGKKYLAYFSDFDQRYTDKISRIRKYYNVGFTKFILTLAVESLAEYNESKQKGDPFSHKKIFSCITAVFKTFNIDDHIKITDNGPIVELTNQFSMGRNILHLSNRTSLKENHITYNFIDKFNRFSNELNRLNNSIDFQYNYWQIKTIASYLPSPLFSHYLDYNSSSFGISNLPGLTNQLFVNTDLDDIAVIDLMHWIPNFRSTGLGLTISKYGGNVILTFITDTAVMPKQEDADNFLTRIINYIDVLHEAIETIS